MIRLGFSYDRPAPREDWERQIWTIAPPSHFVTWLKLRYEPGDPWEPVGRWFIYQMRSPRLLLKPPRGLTHPHPRALELFNELRGPDPRSKGHYCANDQFSHCACRNKTGLWKGGAARKIDRAQWELFQETGHYGTRWWCIQGDSGGHRHRLDETEARVSRINGGPGDTPIPGDLPYAEWDLRVFRKVAELDRVRMWKGVTDYVHRNPETMDAAERDEGEAAQRALWSWLQSQVTRTVDKIGHSGAVALKEAAPRVLDKPKPLDEEAIQQDFIVNGF